jgi:hypothetical protein
MKREITTILMILYTSTALGMGVHFHFCRGQVAGVSLLNNGDYPGCSCDTQETPQECCTDYVVFQKADFHYAPSDAVPAFFSMPLVPFIRAAQPVPFREVQELRYHDRFDKSRSGSIFLLIRVLRI